MVILNFIGNWIVKAWSAVKEVWKLNERVKELEGIVDKRRMPSDSCGKPMKIAAIPISGQYWEDVSYQCEDPMCFRNKKLKTVRQTTSHRHDWR